MVPIVRLVSEIFEVAINSMSFYFWPQILLPPPPPIKMPKIFQISHILPFFTLFFSPKSTFFYLLFKLKQNAPDPDLNVKMIRIRYIFITNTDHHVNTKGSRKKNTFFAADP